MKFRFQLLDLLTQLPGRVLDRSVVGGRRRHRPAGLLAAAPYALDLARDTRRHGPGFGLARLAADAITFAALTGASLRSRSPVL